MPGNVDAVANERQALLAFLAQQRYVVALSAFGLDEAQARATCSPSELSVGGIIKHLVSVERFWMDVVLARTKGHNRAEDYQRTFRLGPEESLAEVLSDYAQVAEETEKIVASFDDLGEDVAVPPEVPWFPKDTTWSVRWVLMHLIEETARHAGHADIVRESIDGATAFSLMAAAEDWPPSPWIKPWEPRS